MARQRKTKTKAMIEGEQNLAGMKAIKNDLDLEHGASVAEGEEILNDERQLIEKYNGILAEGDAILNQIQAKDRQMMQFNRKIKPAVALKYGIDSSEYEMVGGTRESERKKPGKKSKTPTV